MMRYNMKQYICEIFRTTYENHSGGYDNCEEHKDVFYINPDTFTGSCGIRYHTIYCDKNFLNDDKGKQLVEYIFKPLATLDGGKGIVFV